MYYNVFMVLLGFCIFLQQQQKLHKNNTIQNNIHENENTNKAKTKQKS